MPPTSPSAKSTPAIATTLPNWTIVPTGPGGRYLAVMAYDSADNEAVLFGGYNGTSGQVLSDTWIYKDGWTPLNLTKHPAASYGASMAYDYKDRYVVLFGGYGASGYSAKTWKFLHNAWTQLTPAKSPPGVYAASMAWDSNDSYMVLFGGYQSTGHQATSTWTFVGGAWTMLSPTSHPAGRSFQQLAYDNADGWILLFGGYNVTNGALSDTWNFSHGQWTQRHPSASPPATNSGAMSNDSSDGIVILFGGLSSTGKIQGTTWSFSNRTWTPLTPASPPSARDLETMTFDKALNKLVLFGGVRSGIGVNFLGDFWTFHGIVWAHVLPTAPASRGYAMMVYDEGDGYVLLFGGFGNYFGPLNDTWTFLHGHWTQLKPRASPAARYGAGIAYDALDGYVVLFGGYGPTGNLLNDTWTFHAGKWTHLTTLLAPEARGQPAMAYDATDAYVVMTGGYGAIPNANYNGFLNDTWTFAGGQWSEAVYDCSLLVYTYSGPCSPRPPAGVSPVFAYDAYDGYVLYYGGYNYSTGTVLSQTWAWTGGVWYNLTSTAGAPPDGGLYYAAATYDTTDGYVLVYGGVDANLYIVNTTWEFSGGTWSQLNPPANPYYDYVGAMAFDAADSEVVYLPGSTYAHGTWVY